MYLKSIRKEVAHWVLVVCLVAFRFFFDQLQSYDFQFTEPQWKLGGVIYTSKSGFILAGCLHQEGYDSTSSRPDVQPTTWTQLHRSLPLWLVRLWLLPDIWLRLTMQAKVTKLNFLSSDDSLHHWFTVTPNRTQVENYQTVLMWIYI